jgi:Fe-S cluster assembly scaffold protein SufB
MAVVCTIPQYRAYVENYLRQLEEVADDEWMIAVGGFDGNVDVRAPSTNSDSKRIGTIGFPKHLFAKPKGTAPLQQVFMGSIDRDRLVGSLAVKRDEVSESAIEKHVADQEGDFEEMLEGTEEAFDIVSEALSDATGVAKDQLTQVTEHALLSAQQRANAMEVATDGGQDDGE